MGAFPSMGSFSGSRRGSSSSVAPTAEDILPKEKRKAAMTYLDPQESKLALGALILATVAGIALPAYIIAENKVTKLGKNSIAVAPDAKLLGGVLLVLCVIGFVALWKRRRTLVVFDLFLIGFAFTLFIGLVGFVFILLGGWFMLRAWRISRYGTTNSKLIAKEAATRPRGRQRRETATTTTKTSTTPAGRKPPTASKRYTPKAPTRKKIPKPTE
jgi:hypothetical protein